MRFTAFLTIIGVAVAALAATGTPPEGLGKLKFGMKPAAAEQLYPGLRKLDREHLGATPVFNPDIVRQLLPEQALPGLAAPVRVEVRYWKERLWVIIVYFGRNPDQDVYASMEKTYGPPTGRHKTPYWNWEKTTITADANGRWYALIDNALSKEVQALFAQDMRETRKRRAAERRTAAAARRAAGTPTPPTSGAAPPTPGSSVTTKE